jgi:hypothetical protein
MPALALERWESEEVKIRKAAIDEIVPIGPMEFYYSNLLVQVVLRYTGLRFGCIQIARLVVSIQQYCLF